MKLELLYSLIPRELSLFSHEVVHQQSILSWLSLFDLTWNLPNDKNFSQMFVSIVFQMFLTSQIPEAVDNNWEKKIGWPKFLKTELSIGWNISDIFFLI